MRHRTWIVHPDAAVRATLLRWLGDGTAGEPSLEAFEGAPEPEVVLLHASAAPEEALEFAHRVSGQHPGAGWVLLRDPSLPEAWVAATFRGLGAVVLAWPPRREALERALSEARRGGSPTPLAGRRQRDALVRRFARTFGDLELPDPTRGLPGAVLVQGEPGTGRLLFARMVHALLDGDPGFVHLSCGPEVGLAELGARLQAVRGDRCTVCLERPEELAPAVQRELRGWIAYGPTAPPLPPERVVWIGLVEERAGSALPLEPELAEVLGSVLIRIPPLRERPGAAETFAESFVREWCLSRGATPRALTAEARALLAADSWPGNVAELEAALQRALAAGGEGPIRPEDLLAGASASARLAAARATAEAPPAGAEREPAAAPAPEPAPQPRPGPPAPEPAAPSEVPALATALAHELRNPMVSIRTFASLLPERMDDPAFAEEFRRQMERDVGVIEARLARLQRFAELDHGDRKPVDVSALLERLLGERRAEIQRRRLLVLRELESEQPLALASEERLTFAFEALLDAALSSVGDRADLYLAARHHPTGLDGGPAMRVLMRFHSGPGAVEPGGSLRVATSLDLLLARVALETCGGTLHLESADEDERVVSVDLPAPPG